MNNAMIYRAFPEETILPGTHETALRLVLEEARQLAAQSRLLALNAAIESAGDHRDAEAVEEMGALGGSAGQAVAEAEKVANAVERLLLQIQSTSSLSKPL